MAVSVVAELPLYTVNFRSVVVPLRLSTMLSLVAPLPRSKKRALLLAAVGYTHTPALKPLVVKLLRPVEGSET